MGPSQPSQDYLPVGDRCPRMWQWLLTATQGAQLAGPSLSSSTSDFGGIRNGEQK